MKTLKAFIKPFEASQRSVEIKIWLNFYFDTTFKNALDGKGYMIRKHLRIPLEIYKLLRSKSTNFKKC